MEVTRESVSVPNHKTQLAVMSHFQFLLNKATCKNMHSSVGEAYAIWRVQASSLRSCCRFVQKVTDCFGLLARIHQTPRRTPHRPGAAGCNIIFSRYRHEIISQVYKTKVSTAFDHSLDVSSAGIHQEISDLLSPVNCICAVVTMSLRQRANQGILIL